MHRTTTTLAALALAATLAACSSTPVPTAQMAATQSAVESASAAPQVSDAAGGELSQAQDKYARAQKAMDAKDYVQARRLAEEAEVDARLAQAKAGAAASERTAAELQAALTKLREDIARAEGAAAAPAPAGN